MINRKIFCKSGPRAALSRPRPRPAPFGVSRVRISVSVRFQG